MKLWIDQQMTMPIKCPSEDTAARFSPCVANPCRGPWGLVAAILASRMAFMRTVANRPLMDLS